MKARGSTSTTQKKLAGNHIIHVQYSMTDMQIARASMSFCHQGMFTISAQDAVRMTAHGLLKIEI